MNEGAAWAMTVGAAIVGLAVGWCWRELQLRHKRMKARHRRQANERRKKRGQPKIGVHQTKGMRREMQQVMPWGPFPTTVKPAGQKAWEQRKAAEAEGFKLSMSADEWLEDTHKPEDESEPLSWQGSGPIEDEKDLDVNELPADELAKWRGRAKPAKKLDDHEIMQALLSEDDAADFGITKEDGAQE